MTHKRTRRSTRTRLLLKILLYTLLTATAPVVFIVVLAGETLTALWFMAQLITHGIPPEVGIAAGVAALTGWVAVFRYSWQQGANK